ncbi:MAG: hypothetical protein Q8N88_04510, partial [Nanoarchaeota archaeon]|nr:hypothetical protein [Nanoarchaeota archaeon]
SIERQFKPLPITEMEQRKEKIRKLPDFIIAKKSYRNIIILLISLVLAIIIGGVLVFIFWDEILKMAQ